MDSRVTRRRVLEVMVGGTLVTTIILPTRWVRPVVDSVIVPAHAAFSLFTTTSTTSAVSPTTSAPTTAAPTTAAPTTVAPTTTGTTPAPTTTGA